MTDFKDTNWAKKEFSQNYREHADVYIVERRRMLSLLQSFYLRFVTQEGARKILDLGCGDGIATSAIADVDPSITATLVDGSEDMLLKARERLPELRQAAFLRLSFQEIILDGRLEGTFDFIVSSMAIHHLTLPEKRALFDIIRKALKPGGYFLNIDVVLAPSDALEQWYLALWKDWIRERKQLLGMTGEQFDDIAQRYKDLEENKPDTLSDQLDALREIGFAAVDCYYKYGIFAIYGGRKDEARWPDHRTPADSAAAYEDTPMDIEYIRKNIDQLDSMIITLLAKRADMVSAAATLKKNEQAVRDPKRVEQVIEKVRMKAVQAGLDPEIAEKTYRTLIDCFIGKEMSLFKRSE